MPLPMSNGVMDYAEMVRMLTQGGAQPTGDVVPFPGNSRFRSVQPIPATPPIDLSEQDRLNFARMLAEQEAEAQAMDRWKYGK